MTILTTILLVLAAIIALFLIAGLFMGKTYNIHREIIIDVPQQKAFDYLKLLRNQDNFNKWVMVEPNMKKQFTGTDGTVGFIYAWKGKKAGEGEQEIKALIEGRKIETEIRFVKPFAGIAPHADFTTESLLDNQTKVSWTNESQIKYPLNGMLPIIEKMLAKDMDTSLLTLKKLLEK
jgi:hypothetical protein